MTTEFKPGDEMTQELRRLTRVAELLEEEAGGNYRGHVGSVYTDDDLGNNFDSVDVWTSLDHSVEEDVLIDVLEDVMGDPWQITYGEDTAEEFYKDLGFKVENGNPVKLISPQPIEQVEIDDSQFTENEFAFILSTEDGNRVQKYIGKNTPKRYEEVTNDNGDVILRDTGEGGKRIERVNYTEIDWNGSDFYIGPQKQSMWGEGSRGRTKILARYLNEYSNNK
jgi:hypothetical protein